MTTRPTKQSGKNTKNTSVVLSHYFLAQACFGCLVCERRLTAFVLHGKPCAARCLPQIERHTSQPWMHLRTWDPTVDKVSVPTV